MRLSLVGFSLWRYGGELGAESDFLSHENVPSTSLIAFLLRAGDKISNDNDPVALLELVSEFFDVQVIFLGPVRSDFDGHVSGFSINISLVCFGVVPGRRSNRHPQDCFVSLEILAYWRFGDVADKGEGNISHSLFLVRRRFENAENISGRCRR